MDSKLPKRIKSTKNMVRWLKNIVAALIKITLHCSYAYVIIFVVMHATSRSQGRNWIGTMACYLLVFFLCFIVFLILQVILYSFALVNLNTRLEKRSD